MVLVDNGCTTDAVDRLRDEPGVTVVSPGTNTGFAGGCNLGARHARGDVLAFINGDAVVRPDALRALADALATTRWAWRAARCGSTTSPR